MRHKSRIVWDKVREGYDIKCRKRKRKWLLKEWGARRVHSITSDFWTNISREKEGRRKRRKKKGPLTLLKPPPPRPHPHPDPDTLGHANIY